MIEDYKISLSILSVLLGFISIYLIRKTLIGIRERQIRNLEKRQTVSAIQTDSPIDEPKSLFKEEGVANIKKRFSIIRNSATVLIVSVMLLLATIPLLNMVPATILSIVAGSFAIIIGIISKPFIENYISGVIIGLNRSFKVGDTVLLDEQYGVIEDISMTNTIVKLWDWRRVIIPNAKMLNKEIISYTLNDSFIWTKVEFWVSYETDLNMVKNIAVAAAQKSPYFLKSEEPSFWVMEMGQKGYRCWLAAWSNSPANAWELGNQIRSELIMKFQELHIRAHAFHFNFEKEKYDGTARKTNGGKV